MKKRDRKKLNDKVILFPDLEKRLLEKGLESLHQKKFREAVNFLEEAMVLEPENSEIHIGLVLAYFESGLLPKAKELANRMLQTGIGNYIQVIELYLMILIQLNQYDEIVTTIEGLLEEREVPKEKFEHFTRMLQFSRRMVESTPEKEIKQAVPKPFMNKELQLFSCQNQEEQMLLVAQLTERNIQPYIEEIKSYLCSKEGQLFFKTMLLNLLSEQEYDKVVIIEKLDRETTLKPVDLLKGDVQPQQKKLLKFIGDNLEHENPILFENIKSLIERHFFLIYPFQLEPYRDAVWAAAYHSLAAEYHGFPIQIEDLVLLYEINEEDLMRAGLFLMKIEEISYPNF